MAAKNKDSSSDPYIEGLINENNRLNGHGKEPQDIVSKGYVITGGHLIAFAIFLITATSTEVYQRYALNSRMDHLNSRMDDFANLAIFTINRQGCINRALIESSITKAPYRGQCEDIVKAK